MKKRLFARETKKQTIMIVNELKKSKQGVELVCSNNLLADRIAARFRTGLAIKAWYNKFIRTSSLHGNKVRLYKHKDVMPNE